MFCLLQDVLEMQNDAVEPGQKVVVIDDLLATGGKFLKRYRGTIQCYGLDIKTKH